MTVEIVRLGWAAGAQQAFESVPFIVVLYLLGLRSAAWLAAFKAVVGVAAKVEKEMILAKDDHPMPESLQSEEDEFKEPTTDDFDCFSTPCRGTKNGCKYSTTCTFA